MSEYREAIETAIDKEKDVLGRKTALQVAENVSGLEVDEDGEVQELAGEARAVLDDLVESYQDVGGSVSASLIAKRLKKEDLDDLELPDRLEERFGH